MDALHELCMKYESSHYIVICGDLNADHYHRNNIKERKLKELIREDSLLDPGLASPCDTYVNIHLGHSSRIDHFLFKNFTSDSIELLSITQSNLEINTSLHLPLTANITIPHPNTIKTSKKPKSATVRKIFDYSSADPHFFATVLEQELATYDLGLLDTEGALRTLQLALNTASYAAIPYRTSRQYGGKKSSKTKWTPELAEAVRASKQAKYAWECAGKPGKNHPLWLKKKKATKLVRSVQRKEEASQRAKLRQDISTAMQNDQALFFKLMRRQRQNTLSTPALRVDGALITDPDAIREEFASASEKLATPDSTESHTTALLDHARHNSRLGNDPIQLDPGFIKKTILQLKNNKAADKEGFKAEHLKFLTHSERAVSTLTDIINKIFHYGHMPHSAKSAYKTPVPKKGKNPLLTDNYRGITVTSIFGKLVEHLIKQLGGDDMNHDQSPLQFGFTEGSNPNMASLIITESLVEARESRQELFICSLDARKAFDIVPHDLLKLKLYNTRIRRPLWLLVDDLYTGNFETIRWQGVESREYMVRQGVRQGGIISTDLYKLFCNDRLITLRNSNLGFHVGCNYLGATAVADDQVLISNSKHELQSMMSICHDYAIDHKEILHPTKSVVVALRSSNQDNVNHGWRLGDEEVSVERSFTHLGLCWNSGASAPAVEERIKSARRTSYSLMGIGFHGKNGLDPATSSCLVDTYITPRLLYGLNAANLSKSQITKLSHFHKTLLRQLQGLPQNSALCIIYLLLGTLPLEAFLELSQLSLIGAVARLEWSSPLKQTAIRQLSVKTSSSHSWFYKVAAVGSKYGLDIYNLITHPWPKLAWKKHTRLLVTDYWNKLLLEEATSKITLRWMLLSVSWIGKPHPAWNCCRGKPYQTTAAVIRISLLIGRYGLQQERKHYTKQEESALCPLCKSEEEDVSHFLLRCPKRYQSSSMLRDLQCMYEADGRRPPTSHHELTSAILNGWGYCMGGHVGFCSQDSSCNIIKLNEKGTPANQLCNTICHHMHVNRDHKLNSLLMD